jgi:hypothetical protein
MDTLPLELFSVIAATLQDTELRVLYDSSTTLRSGLQSVSETPRFWQDRCSTLLGIELQDEVVHWKRVYNNLSQSTQLSKYASEDNTDTVLVLLKAGGNSARSINHALFLAVRDGCTEVVRLLLAAGGDPSPGYPRTVIMASEHGYTEIVRLLLADSRTDPGVDDNWAIRLASKNGHTEVVRLLLADSRVNPAAKDNDAIKDTASRGHLETVRLLLADSRVNAGADRNIAIGFAANYGHVEAVRLLLADPRVNPADNNGC